MRWFEKNYMKLNTYKYYVIVSGYKNKQVFTNTGKNCCKKLLMVAKIQHLIN